MAEEAAGEAIARAFVAARQSGRALADYPGALPETLDLAYAIQAAARRLHGGRIAGWKVGRIADPLVQQFGTNRLTGPIFEPGVVESIEGEPEMPVFADGFAAAEAEFLMRLGDPPADFDRPWTNAEVAAFVDEVRIGLEIASSPYPGINDHGPAVTISDFGNNNGLVLGASISAEEDFLGWPVTLTIDGEVAGTATAGAMLDGPLGAVRFLFELAASRGIPLAKGQWISTGAVTGVHPVRPGARVEARFGGAGRVRCRIAEGLSG